MELYFCLSLRSISFHLFISVALMESKSEAWPDLKQQRRRRRRLRGSFAQQQPITLKSLPDVSVYGLLFTNWSCSCDRVFKAMRRLTCLKEWVIWLFPEVKKRYGVTLMSWLSVWICSDLRRWDRGRGDGGKETGHSEWLLFCLQFENQDLPPQQERKRKKNSILLVPTREWQWSETGGF